MKNKCADALLIKEVLFCKCFDFTNFDVLHYHFISHYFCHLTNAVLITLDNVRVKRG